MSTINWVAFALQMVIMVFFPIGLAIFFHRRFHVSWAVFFIAAGFYLINLLVQLPFIYAWYSLFNNALWIRLVLVTLTYAVSEETMRYLSFRAGRVMRANRTMNGALMAGVGHGGTESIIFAIGAVLTLLTALYAPLRLGGTAESLLQTPWGMFVMEGVGRIFAVTAHIGFATLIVLAYRRTWRFYPLAILLHFLVDFSTFGIQSLTNSTLWTMIVFAFWAIVALVFILRVRRMNIPEEKEPIVESVVA